jgi:hypothetical protein
MSTLISSLLIFSLFQTITIHKNETSVEFENRIKTTEIIYNYIEHNSTSYILVTENILLYQIISNNSFCVCDITQFYNDYINIANKDIFFLLSEETPCYLRKRYNIELPMPFQEPILECREMKLYKISM